MFLPGMGLIFYFSSARTSPSSASSRAARASASPCSSKRPERPTFREYRPHSAGPLATLLASRFTRSRAALRQLDHPTDGASSMDRETLLAVAARNTTSISSVTSSATTDGCHQRRAAPAWMRSQEGGGVMVHPLRRRGMQRCEKAFLRVCAAKVSRCSPSCTSNSRFLSKSTTAPSKIAIVDGRVGFISGMNIAAMSTGHGVGIVARHHRIEGNGAAGLQKRVPE